MVDQRSLLRILPVNCVIIITHREIMSLNQYLEYMLYYIENFIINNSYYYCVCMHACTCQSVYMEVRGQLWGGHFSPCTVSSRD